MARNIRQRRRLQLKRKNRMQVKVLTFVVAIMAIVCVASFVVRLVNERSLDSLFRSTAEEFAQNDSNEVVEPENVLPTDDTVDDSSSNSKASGDATFVLSGLGDISCFKSLSTDAYEKVNNSYDFSYIFENVKYYTQTSDLVIGNLETSFAGADRGLSDYNSPDNLASNLKSLGINVLSTANDHCLDFGFEGLSRTVDILNKADISHLGTYKSQEDHDSILFKYSKGVKVAILNYTAPSKGLKVPNDKAFCVNQIDKDSIASDVKKARDQKADVVVACMHWGKEFQSTPNNEQKELADFLFQQGVDVILGNNPRVLQPMEKRTVSLPDGSQKDGFIVYSLGSFTCDLSKEACRSSAILNIKITKHQDGGLTIDEAKYVPIYMFKKSSDGSNVKASSKIKFSSVSAKDLGAHAYKIYDIERSLQAYDAGDLSLGSKNYEFLKNQLDFIKNALEPS